MITYGDAKKLVQNPGFPAQREKVLKGLNLGLIDKPIVDLIAKISKNPNCFSLQSCYGHFLYPNQRDSGNVEPLPDLENDTEVEYRIAYIAICVENNQQGLGLVRDLSNLTSIDPQYVQFGSADWFWEQQVNSFVVQVEPGRYKTQDRCIIKAQEGFTIEKVRNRFFEELENIFCQSRRGQGLIS